MAARSPDEDNAEMSFNAACGISQSGPPRRRAGERNSYSHAESGPAEREIASRLAIQAAAEAAGACPESSGSARLVPRGKGGDEREGEEKDTRGGRGRAVI